MSKADKIQKSNEAKYRKKVRAFADEYGELCRKYGLCITDDIYGNPMVSGSANIDEHLEELEEDVKQT